MADNLLGVMAGFGLGIESANFLAHVGFGFLALSYCTKRMVHLRICLCLANVWLVAWGIVALKGEAAYAAAGWNLLFFSSECCSEDSPHARIDLSKPNKSPTIVLERPSFSAPSVNGRRFYQALQVERKKAKEVASTRGVRRSPPVRVLPRAYGLPSTPEVSPQASPEASPAGSFGPKGNASAA